MIFYSASVIIHSFELAAPTIHWTEDITRYLIFKSDGIMSYKHDFWAHAEYIGQLNLVIVKNNNYEKSVIPWF